MVLARSAEPPQDCQYMRQLAVQCPSMGSGMFSGSFFFLCKCSEMTPMCSSYWKKKEVFS